MSRSAISTPRDGRDTEDAMIHQGRLDRGVALLSKPYRRRELARKLREVIAGVG